jgi:hypothetical protein
MAWTSWPSIPPRDWGGGVYALYHNGALVYVGRTWNFASRISGHRHRFQFDIIKTKWTKTQREAKWIERKLLFRLRPPRNRTIPTDLHGCWQYRPEVRRSMGAR